MSAYDLAAGLLRRLEPETAHRLTLRALEAGLGPRAGNLAADPILAVDLAGLRLPNPIGLAAGFDKDAQAFAPMLRAGFGFVECGTVTPLPQVGNPRPRLFRLVEDRAVINRMGFNNGGLDAFAARLENRHRQAGVVGANIGANKDAVDRIGDYVAGLRRVFALADYISVNISSPNTPGLRTLQTAGALDELGERLAQARAGLQAAAGAKGPPMFLKIAPDLDEAEIEALISGAARHGFDGLIVSNTTLARPAELKSAASEEAGGLSGTPLFEPSTRVLRQVATMVKGSGAKGSGAKGSGLVLIAAGGVASGGDALAKIMAGAHAVQLYTALVYAGPGVVVRMAQDLAKRLRAEGFARVEDAVGAGLS